MLKCICGNATIGGGWDGIGFIVGDVPLSKYSCGYQFDVKVAAQIKFVSGGYNCVGTDADPDCKAKISAIFYNGTSIVRTVENFDFSTEILSFTIWMPSFQLVTG